MLWTFGLPIEQLNLYQGETPRPSNFDLFWARSLAEMRSIDPKVETLLQDVKCYAPPGL